MSKMMKTLMAICLIVVLLMALLSRPALSNDRITITGTVNADEQLVTEIFYDIADTDKGNEVKELFNQKVKLIGTVTIEKGKKVITVISYEVLEEE